MDGQVNLPKDEVFSLKMQINRILSGLLSRFSPAV